MASDNHIVGKSIVVTGAASGFGDLVTRKALARGAQVAALDISPVDHEQNDSLLIARADVTDAGQMQMAVDAAIERFGRIDVLVNNAGTMPLAFYSDHARALDAWTRCLDVNIKGVLNGIAAVYNHMMARSRGHIDNLSSIYGNYPVAGAGVYGATKAAVNFLSEALRVECQGKIKVTVIRPTGVPATGLAAGIVNPQAIVGLTAQNTAAYVETVQAYMSGSLPDEQRDANHPQYAVLHPEAVADGIIHAIDQPWGVSVSDVTIRATGEPFIL